MPVVPPVSKTRNGFLAQGLATQRSVASPRSHPPGNLGKRPAGGGPGWGAMAALYGNRHQVAMRVARPHKVDANAPNLVLRFQNSAATIIGARAAKPENAKRTASSKIETTSLSVTAST